MEPISKAIYTQPYWVQPKTFENRFELRDENQLFATLTFPNVFGSLGTAISASGRWTFKRVGFFSTRITIRVEGQEDDLGIFHPRWTGTEGTLKLTGGAAYTWKVANFWGSRFTWQNEAGQILVTYQSGADHFDLADLVKTQARVEIYPEASGLEELSLLVIFGWYVIILKQQDDTAAIAATSAV